MIETIISREICRAPRGAHKPTLFVKRTTGGQTKKDTRHFVTVGFLVDVLM